MCECECVGVCCVPHLCPTSTRRIEEAHRTCSIWLGVGDANEKTFRLFEYSKSTANVSYKLRHYHSFYQVLITHVRILLWCAVVIFQVFDDKNITMINESRFNREHCDDACYHNYSMTGI